MHSTTGLRMVDLALALAVASVTGVTRGYAQTQGQERREDRRDDGQDARDTRQTGRQGARDAKEECKKGDETAPASDSGRLRHGEAAHGRSDLQRRAFMLTMLFDGTIGGSRPSLRISYR